MKSIADIFRSYGVLADGGGGKLCHVNGTDKETNHRYGAAYERIFTVQSPSDDPGHLVRAKYPHSIRDEVELMMEVGVADGSSLLAWSEVFPNAICVGLDIHPAVKARGPRIEFYTGNATWQRDCEAAAGGRQFDFIVDDATHRLEDILVTLFYLWPSVRPGGLYVVEEFCNVGNFYHHINALLPNALIVETQGPFGGIEPLVVLRKSL